MSKSQGVVVGWRDRCKTLSSALFFCLWCANPALSLPTVAVGVEVGLDSGTKELLDRLPQKLSDAFVDAVNKSMERVDFSVATYIKTAQAAASQTMVELACLGDGTLANGVDEVTRGISTLLLGDVTNLVRSGQYATASGIDPASQNLYNQIDTSRRNLHDDTSAIVIYGAYSDLAFSTAKLICKQMAVHAPVEFADDQLALLRKSLGEWRILNFNAYCSNPSDCLRKRKADLEKIITNEDPKLVDAASVRSQYRQLVSDVGAGVPESDWQQLVDRLRRLIGSQSPAAPDITHTESVLFGLRDVELKIAAVKGNWQWQAINQWNTAKSILDPLPTELTGIGGEMNSSAHNYNIEIDSEHAFNNLRDVKTKLIRARALVQQAKALDPRLNSDEGFKEIDALEKTAAQDVEQICGIYLTPHGLFRFDSRYGAFNWCNANKTNRWNLYPTLP
jgi:hypothetical protein